MHPISNLDYVHLFISSTITTEGPGRLWLIFARCGGGVATVHAFREALGTTKSCVFSSTDVFTSLHSVFFS